MRVKSRETLSTEVQRLYLTNIMSTQMKKSFRILGNVGIADDNDVFSSAEQNLGEDQHSDRLCKWLSIRPGFVSSGVVDMSTISIMFTTETTTMMIIDHLRTWM